MPIRFVDNKDGFQYGSKLDPLVIAQMSTMDWVDGVPVNGGCCSQTREIIWVEDVGDVEVKDCTFLLSNEAVLRINCESVKFDRCTFVYDGSDLIACNSRLSFSGELLECRNCRFIGRNSYLEGCLQCTNRSRMRVTFNNCTIENFRTEGSVIAKEPCCGGAGDGSIFVFKGSSMINCKAGRRGIVQFPSVQVLSLGDRGSLFENCASKGHFYTVPPAISHRNAWCRARSGRCFLVIGRYFSSFRFGL